LRAALPFILFAMVGCSSPGPWQKPGAMQSEAATELASCQQEAKAAIERLYSFSFPYPYPLGWNGGRQVGYLEWQQRVETFKSYEESRLATACMQAKGYREAG
jgi:hypothetical protein